MWFQIDGWYWQEPRTVVVARVRRTLSQLGVQVDELLERQASVDLDVEGTPVTLEVSKYTEDHTLLHLKSQRVTAPVHALFEQTYSAILQEQNPCVGELIWGWNAEELAPVLMHSHWRGEYPSPLSILDPTDLSSRLLQPKEDAYWMEVGPRLHFVHQRTMSRFREHAYSPAVLGDRMGRPAQSSVLGVVFDCGWSLRWPDGIPDDILASKN